MGYYEKYSLQIMNAAKIPVSLLFDLSSYLLYNIIQNSKFYKFIRVYNYIRFPGRYTNPESGSPGTPIRGWSRGTGIVVPKIPGMGDFCPKNGKSETQFSTRKLNGKFYGTVAHPVSHLVKTSFYPKFHITK